VGSNRGDRPLIDARSRDLALHPWRRRTLPDGWLHPGPLPAKDKEREKGEMMDKKERTQHGKKESSPKQDHLRKSDQGESTDTFGNYQPTDQGKGMGKGAGSQEKGWNADGGGIKQEKEWLPNDGGLKQEKGWLANEDGLNQGKWISEGGSKNEAPWIPEVGQTQSGCLTKLKSGCFPKAAILFLALITIGASLILA
jgi:hypothetical protein